MFTYAEASPAKPGLPNFSEAQMTMDNTTLKFSHSLSMRLEYREALIIQILSKSLSVATKSSLSSQMVKKVETLIYT